MEVHRVEGAALEGKKSVADRAKGPKARHDKAKPKHDKWKAELAAYRNRYPAIQGSQRDFCLSVLGKVKRTKWEPIVSTKGTEKDIEHAQVEQIRNVLFPRKRKK